MYYIVTQPNIHSIILKLSLIFYLRSNWHTAFGKLNLLHIRQHTDFYQVKQQSAHDKIITFVKV